MTFITVAASFALLLAIFSCSCRKIHGFSITGSYNLYAVKRQNAVQIAAQIRRRLGKTPWLQMRDGSTSAGYFQIGDKVTITTDVWHRPKGKENFSSKGLHGVIVDIWEKCEVDPHCCCAELAHDAPFKVQFDTSHYEAEATSSKGKWDAQFAEDEITLGHKDIALVDNTYCNEG
mmetsp:Transcript_19975/g.33973  ORF Transcript_19975/g.33973 Transcript_19975/m.33973 type:complete len:175 (+) Transcript_19975:140-664(+)